MAYFQGAGYIGSDLTRRETAHRGVVTTFRLASGVAGHGQLWIDIEAWGNQAGILNVHGHEGRGVMVNGRLTQKSWQDRDTHEQRSRLIVTAHDFDFLDEQARSQAIDVTNQVTAHGRVEGRPRPDTHDSSNVLFTLVDGRAGNKTGRVSIPVLAWGRRADAARGLQPNDRIVVSGRLSYRRESDHQPKRGHYFVNLYGLHRSSHLAVPGLDTDPQQACHAANSNATVAPTVRCGP